MNFPVPSGMRCIEISAPGGPEVLRFGERPTPKPGTGEVLIRVIASGVNRADLMQRQGRYPPPPGASDILGLEVAGVIVALGEGVRGFKVSDRVCALLTGGGYAEYCVAPAPQCLTIPSRLDFIQAAAVPEAFFTVWTNVFERGRLASGEILLIHGGASGIGTTAIQLARRRGSRVMVTVGSTEKARACQRLGAERAINYRTEDFATAVREFTGGRGVNVILDMVGGDYLERNIEALAVEGRLVEIAVQKGSKGQIDLLRIMQRRLTLTGSTLRSRSIEEKRAIAEALRREVWPLLESGEIAPVIHSTFPLRDAAEAHRLMETGSHIGKIVLVTGQAAD
jgi:NADPH:quinone reductase